MIDRLQAEVIEKNPECRELEEKFSRIFSISDTGLCDVYPSFDRDHHTLGYTTLFEKGIIGILNEIHLKNEIFSPDSEEFIFLTSAEESCNAVLKIAERFSELAEELLKTVTSNKERESLILIRDTAKRIPANKPEKHKDLVVRISGLSAYFVALEPHIQDEIIARNLYNI